MKEAVDSCKKEFSKDEKQLKDLSVDGLSQMTPMQKQDVLMMPKDQVLPSFIQDKNPRIQENQDI